MSHEIRTPMNGIIGMLTLAENKLEANSPAMQYLTKADELRISQVIINFLSNAVKFTSEGEIIVTFRQMMLQNGVADWCSMRQRLGLVCLVYWCCLQHFLLCLLELLRMVLLWREKERYRSFTPPGTHFLQKG